MTKPRTLLEDSISMSKYMQTSGAKIEKFSCRQTIKLYKIFPCLFDENSVEINSRKIMEFIAIDTQ